MASQIDMKPRLSGRNPQRLDSLSNQQGADYTDYTAFCLSCVFGLTSLVQPVRCLPYRALTEFGRKGGSVSP